MTGHLKKQDVVNTEKPYIMANQLTIVRGTPNFGKIDINPDEIAKCLQDYVTRGSSIIGVAKEDIDVRLVIIPTGEDKKNLTMLVKGGMKLFDAIAYLSFPESDRPELINDNSRTVDQIPGMMEIAKAVFYCYFFLLTQARYPVSSNTEQKPKVPQFLKGIMQLDQGQETYIDKLCSFEASKFDPRWIKYVKFQGMGQEALSRFGLGVAGYRLFGPFKYYEVKKEIPQNLSAAVSFASSIAKSSPTWDIHPVTRNPSVLAKRGNLNKNLGNLILEVFTDDQISEMVNSKILYKKPEPEPTAKNYVQWNPVDDISGTDKIFP